MSIPLDFTAAGLFESLILLVALLGHEQNIILLDEPALNLHPILQKRILDLVEQAISANNQLVIITHSPYFIDYNFVVKSSKIPSIELLYFRKQEDSTVILKSDNTAITLKPHLFRPEIFFSQCNIIVEGAADFATFTAISEGYNDILTRYNIALIDSWGEGNVKQYLPLLNAFKIPFVAIVDDDYKGPTSGGMIILEGKLEDELRKLGWDAEKKRNHIEPDEAYEFISYVLDQQNGKELIQKSRLWDVLRSAFVKIKIDLSERCKV